MKRFVTILAIAVAICGCKKDEPKQETPSAPAASSTVVEKEKAAVPAKKSKKPEPPKPGEKKPAEATKLATYWKAMNAGRKATVAKKYDDAVASFDEALVAMPEDARAYTERGYAKLLAKRYDDAVADLDEAAKRTNDKKLLAQVWYNYGLAAEGKGDADKARAAFARSNELNPTNAAKKKLEGKSSCPATISSTPSSPSKTFASWKEAYEQARDEDDDELPAKYGGEADLAKLCNAGYTKGKACLVHHGGFPIDSLDLYVETKAGTIVFHPLAIAGGRCGGENEGKIVQADDGLVHVHWHTKQGTPVLVAEKKSGEIGDCTEKDDECMTACGDDAHEYGDLIVTGEAAEPMLFVSREGEKDPVTIKVDGPVAKITGKGCDEERPLAR